MVINLNLRASFCILAAILNLAVADPTDHQEKLQTLSERIKASLTNPEILHDLPAHVPKSVLKAQRKESLLRSTGTIEAHPDAGPGAGTGTDIAGGAAHAPQDFSESDISRFTCESLELIHQKCHLPTDIANAFSGVKDLAQNALSTKGPRNNEAHPFEQLMRSITKCSSPNANLFDPSEVSEHVIADYLAKVSKAVSKTRDNKVQSPSISSNTNNQEPIQFQSGRILNKAPNQRILKGALPEWSTHVPPTENQVRKADGEKNFRVDIIGSLPFSSDEMEFLPKLPEVPDFSQTKKGASAKAAKKKSSSLLDNLKNNPVADWLKNLLSSIGFFFNGLKTKAKNHAITIHHKFVADRPAPAENSRPRRAGNFFDLDGVNLAQMLGKPFKNLLSNFQSESSGGSDNEGVKTIKRFLNAALRIYKHTCSPTSVNVELFKSVATQTLSSLSKNGQVIFALNTFVDKSVVKAIDECER